jgi:microcompartment protein CcmL/EutN
MPNLSLGTIEVFGLPAAVEAADVALKTADVKLIGYETTDGMGMVAVKIEGQVSAVQSAVSAACAAAGRVSKVFATSVIPRPSDQLEPVVLTEGTVGLAKPEPVPEPTPPSPTPELSEPQVAPAPAASDNSEGAAQTADEAAAPAEPAARPRAARTRKSAGTPDGSK